MFQKNQYSLISNRHVSEKILCLPKTDKKTSGEADKEREQDVKTWRTTAAHFGRSEISNGKHNVTK